MRHPSEPLYTPEPDVVHEYIGHIGQLAHPELAELNAAFGRASRRTEDPTRITALIRVYWYTLEFGVLREGDQLRAYGAGLLSSFGELSAFETRSELLPWDIERMAQTAFDPTHYQARLFVAPSFERMLGELRDWLDGAAQGGE